MSRYIDADKFYASQAARCWGEPIIGTCTSDNAITNVKCELGTEGYDDVYNIFIFTEDTRISCVQYRGCDNGYYGVGYDLYVKLAEKE